MKFLYLQPVMGAIELSPRQQFSDMSVTLLRVNQHIPRKKFKLSGTGEEGGINKIKGNPITLLNGKKSIREKEN